ncbi:MAG TPA: PAS domain S-box protein [Syntrophales bacterium]|nr:PAS domain S-box protein [Syntrophales bacterium]
MKPTRRTSPKAETRPPSQPEAPSSNRSRSSDHIFRTLTEKSFVGMYVAQNGLFVRVNPTIAAVSGYAVEELEGRRADSLIHPDDVGYVKRVAREMLRGHRTTAHEFRIVTRKGDIRWVMEAVTPITYSGRPAIFGHFMDITDRKAMEEKLRESENLYRTIFETTGTATIIIEEDTTVALVNSEFERLSGAPKAYWEGKRSWLEFAAEKDRDRMLQYHNLRRREPGGAPDRYEFRFVDRKGTAKDVLVTISMIPGTRRSVSSHADITALKRQEKALIRREREIQAKSRNLEEMNTALKVLLKQREQDQHDMEEKVLANIKHLVIPYLGKLKTGRLGEQERSCVKVLESNLLSIISPFSQRLSSRLLNLTPKELQVANLVKEGRTSKEIGDLLDVSPATVALYRNRIRKKLAVTGKKVNLRTYLASLN